MYGIVGKELARLGVRVILPEFRNSVDGHVFPAALHDCYSTGTAYSSDDGDDDDDDDYGDDDDDMVVARRRRRWWRYNVVAIWSGEAYIRRII